MRTDEIIGQHICPICGERMALTIYNIQQHAKLHKLEEKTNPRPKISQEELLKLKEALKRIK